MKRSRCVSFQNRDGLSLHGLLHEPVPSEARGVCVLLLSPGIKGRVGPHRLYVKLSERLARLGFHVLRFDYHGLGDSEGELSERVLVDMYNSIHGGRYVGDTIAAMDWVQRTLGIERFVGSGLCGGSISALLTAEADRRIECLVGIGLPTVLEGGPENWARAITQHQVAAMSGTYFSKLADPKAWLRLLSGKSSYRVIWRVIHDRFRPRGDPPGSDAPAPKAAVDSTNPRFASAFMTMLETGRPMMLFYSGADRLRAQFAENFESHHAERLERYRSLYEIKVIARANHILSDPAWVAELSDGAEAWLAGRYPCPHIATVNSISP
jgi:pimeloyl-ACP methyl ester carboxylesterase